MFFETNFVFMLSGNSHHSHSRMVRPTMINDCSRPRKYSRDLPIFLNLFLSSKIIYDQLQIKYSKKLQQKSNK